MTRGEIKARHAAWAVEYAAGDSLKMIAARAQVTHAAVLFALRALGVKMRPRFAKSPTTKRAHAERTARIVELRRAGTPLRDVAAKVGVCLRLASEVVRNAGLANPPGRPPQRHPRLDEMARDYAAGDSLKTIGARYDIDFSHVSRLLRREGVAMRLRGKPRVIDREAVLAAYASGRKLADVAQAFGIRTSHVSHLASAAGVHHPARRKR